MLASRESVFAQAMNFGSAGADGRHFRRSQLFYDQQARHKIKGSLGRHSYRCKDACGTRAHGGEGLIAKLVRVEAEGGRISADEMV